jgi:dethiobiotin synthetase
MKNKGIFITGTDTGVGKTFVTEGLIRAMKEKGLNVCPMKPLETGCAMRGGRLVPRDTGRLVSAGGISEPLDSINPYRFRQPLAPSVAAEISGVVIRKHKILRLFADLCKRYDVTLVEGAGGVMVPVSGKYLFRDLIRDMNVPALIVSRPGLGTINHTLLTIGALRERGVEVMGVVFNEALRKGRGLSEKTNPDVIGRLGSVPVLGTVPYMMKHDTSRSRRVFGGIGEKMLSRL